MRASRLLALGVAAAAAACAASARQSAVAPTPAPAPAAPAPATSATVGGLDTVTPAVEAPSAVASAEAPAGDAAAASGAAPVAEHAESAEHAGQAAAAGSACNEQAPQDFLIRSNFLKGGQEALQRAIQYRTDTYGYFKGFGHAGAGAAAPSTFVVSTTFMNLPVRMHRKVVPALRCVEEEIKRACADHPYTPQALAGIRFRNTYRGGEVTNHIYGIAIDVDPARNTCCGCVPPWNDAPACKRPAKTEYERMQMPECWVHAFERYGFYWLGHDRLRDTMHFEFLGDPDRIVKTPGDG